MNFLSKHPVIAKAIGSVILIILTAIFTTQWNNYSARAKPYAELVSVDFSRPPAGKGVRIYPTTEIINLSRDAGIGIDKFTGLHSIENWEQFIEMINQQLSTIPFAISTIKEIISDLNNLALDTEERIISARLSLMKKFDDVPMRMLENFTQEVLDRKGYLKIIKRNKNYEKFNKHPEEWKSPSQGRVYYSKNRYFKLWELTPENTRNQESILRGNVFRRMWIYMDKDFMIKVFDDVLTGLEQTLTIAQQLASAMQEQLDTTHPERIHCLVALSNIGDKAAIFKGNASFALKTADGIKELSLTAFQNNHHSDAFCVNGQSSMLVDFYSDESIDNIESNYFPNLRTNYSDKILKCDISLLRLSEDLEYLDLTPRNDRIFGQN